MSLRINHQSINQSINHSINQSFTSWFFVCCIFEIIKTIIVEDKPSPLPVSISIRSLFPQPSLFIWGGEKDGNVDDDDDDDDDDVDDDDDDDDDVDEGDVDEGDVDEDEDESMMVLMMIMMMKMMSWVRIATVARGGETGKRPLFS